MSSKTTFLKRIGENVKKNKLIDLNEKEEVTVGRSPDVTVCLMSVVISRCHAILKKSQSGTWTVKDNKSLNGVLVNGQKLEPHKPYSLKDGDIVQFGVPAKNTQSAESFIYKFHTTLNGKRPRPQSGDEHESAKVARTGRSVSDSEVTSSQPDLDEIDAATQSPHKRLGHRDADSSPYRQFHIKLKEQEEKAKEKMKEYEEKLAAMQKMLQEKESAQTEMKNKLEEEKKEREDQAKVMAELKKKEEELKTEFQDKQEALVREKEELEARMKQELEEQLLVKETNLLDYLETQRQSLLKERQEIEDRLHQEMERALEEKDKKLEEELVSEKEKLNKVIENKQLEQKLLESELNAVKAEKDNEQDAILQAKEDVLSNFAELMETELQCSVCNELFIQATSLNCSHAFCAYCIAEWRKRKNDCPICRTAITTSMRSIVLDSYIDRMVDHLSDDLKTRRTELVKTRKEEQAKLEAENNATTSGTTNARGRGRGRNRGRGRAGGTRGGRGGLLMDAPPVPEVAAIIEVPDDSSSIEVSSEENSTFSDEDDSDGYISGDGAYYGGYGRCFTCGARGHWANGCPFR